MIPRAAPGDPYPFEGKTNPLLLCKDASISKADDFCHAYTIAISMMNYMDRLWRGTTSVEAADKEGGLFNYTKRRMAAGLYCRTYRCRHESAYAKFCIRFN